MSSSLPGKQGIFDCQSLPMEAVGCRRMIASCGQNLGADVKAHKGLELVLQQNAGPPAVVRSKTMLTKPSCI